MKRQTAGLIFSDGSFIFVKRSGVSQSSLHRYLLQDLNNHPSWLDYKVEYGESVEQFVSQFREFKFKNENAKKF